MRTSFSVRILQRLSVKDHIYETIKHTHAFLFGRTPISSLEVSSPIVVGRVYMYQQRSTLMIYQVGGTATPCMLSVILKTIRAFHPYL